MLTKQGHLLLLYKLVSQKFSQITKEGMSDPDGKKENDNQTFPEEKRGEFKIVFQSIHIII